MSMDARLSSSGGDERSPRLAVENPPSDAASVQQSLISADRKPLVFQVSAADVVPPAPASLRLQTFEELGLPAEFRKAVEDELSRDEKLIWLGRPSQNPAAQPPRTAFMVVGGVLLGLAVLLPLLVHGISLVFPVALVLFGLFFLCVPMLFKGANVYPACYALTNRRALLLEKGILGLDPRTITSWKSITGVRCKSYYPHELLGMERRNNERVPGTGDLVFEYIFTIGQASVGFPGVNGTVQRTDVPNRTPRGFFFLEQAAEVENLIRTTLLSGLEKSLDERLQAPAAAVRPVCDGSPAPSRAAAQAAGEAEPYREDGQVPADLKQKALAQLGTGERLVWIAQPVGGVVFRRSLGYLAGGVALVALALLWLGIGFLGHSAAKKGAAASRAITTVSRGTDPVPLVLFVAGLCCAGVPLYRWKMAERSCYALTNRRALVFRQGLFGPAQESYSPAAVARMQRRDCWLSAGDGDLIFHTVVIVRNSYSRQGGFRQRVMTKYYGFLAVARVGEVEKLVRETLIDPFVDKLQAAGAL
jgi:hypothetical protein